MCAKRTNALSVAAAVAVLLGALPAAANEELRNAPWRDTEIAYEHHLDIQGIGPSWTYGHRLDLRPSWHFGYWLELKARLILDQGLSGNSTTDSSIHQSNLLLAAATPGVTEPYSGIQIGGGINFLLPTSQAAQDATMILGLGPAVEIKREFPFLRGISVGYSARLTYHLLKHASQSICSISGCLVGFFSTFAGARVAHGPALRIEAIRGLALEASFLFAHALFFLPRSASLGGPEVSPPRHSHDVISWQMYRVSIGYQVVDFLRVSAVVCNNDSDVLPESTMVLSDPFALARVSVVFTLTADALFRRF
jgi:hypothetical protein